MKIRDVSPMLRTKEIQATVDFYTRILGFTCDASSEDWGWASLSRDGVRVMVAGPNAHEPFDAPAFTGSLYFETADVDDAWRQLKDKARVCYPIEDFEYGMREFAIYDNNGYLLQFGQEIEPAP